MAGGQDAFVTKLDAEGLNLIYSTYLGGGGDDTAWAVAGDPFGVAHVTGETLSANFPVTDGAVQPALSGGSDAFLARIGSAINCSFAGLNPIVRAEAIADIVGDILIRCTSEAPLSEDYLLSELTLTIDNANITNNRGFLGQAGTEDVTDAVLVVAEKRDTSPTAASTLGGADPRFPLPQCGRLADDRTLVWKDVLFPAPDGPLANGQVVMRITNVRVNASQTDPLSADFPNPPVIAGLKLEIAAQNEVSLEAEVSTLGMPIRGNVVETSGLVTSTPCEAPSGSDNRVQIIFTEGFADAYRPLGEPTFFPVIRGPGVEVTEDGYPSPGSGANGGGATQGTRLLLRFSNIPAGVSITVPTSAVHSQTDSTVQLISTSDPNGAGGSPTSNGKSPSSTGPGIAVYEVTQANRFNFENSSFTPASTGTPTTPSTRFPRAPVR